MIMRICRKEKRKSSEWTASSFVSCIKQGNKKSRKLHCFLQVSHLSINISIFLFIIIPKPIRTAGAIACPQDIRQCQQDRAEPEPALLYTPSDQLFLLRHSLQQNTCSEKPYQEQPIAGFFQIKNSSHYETSLIQQITKAKDISIHYIRINGKSKSNIPGGIVTFFVNVCKIGFLTNNNKKSPPVRGLNRPTRGDIYGKHINSSLYRMISQQQTECRWKKVSL